jgi:hypothetical protein
MYIALGFSESDLQSLPQGTYSKEITTEENAMLLLKE